MVLGKLDVSKTSLKSKSFEFSFTVIDCSLHGRKTITLTKEIQKPKEKPPWCIFFKVQGLVSKDCEQPLSDL